MKKNERNKKLDHRKKLSSGYIINLSMPHINFMKIMLFISHETVATHTHTVAHAHTEAKKIC